MTHSEQNRKPNRLSVEKSPYLLQHAFNPVDWYPWSPEAFEKARLDDKPLFVSIGYSTCHWCHVMERESFEDKEVAALMNRVFVCVKVDREERPDLDAAYMEVCQTMGRSCGWPLNIIMTPNKNPFFVASYIPKDNRYGAIGLLDLIPQIEEIWKKRKAEMESIGIQVRQQISEQFRTETSGELDSTILDNAYEQMVLRFDDNYGGFGRAPKFPSPHNFLFLLRYYNRTKDKIALQMVEKTLGFMRLGGIFDQIGFGFHRYSTDEMWLVPHFEKMLYDQALLALAYIETFQVTGALKFKLTAKETLDYVLHNLTFSEGGFYSAEDADSEGVEGKFYVWKMDEIQHSLTTNEAELAIKIFNVLPQGNYSEPLKARTGHNILHFTNTIDQVAQEVGLSVDQLIVQLGIITSKLLESREKRIHPFKDDKLLVDWNGLMIAAFARAAQVFDEEKYLQVAKESADFILHELRMKNGGLYHRYAKGEKAIDGFLDDYAFLVFGLVELYQACFEEKYLQKSIELTNLMIREFWDNERGVFFLTKADTDSSIPRLKQTYDGALPSGNSVALLNLLRLSHINNDDSFGKLAEKMLDSLSEELKSRSIGHTFMLTGLDFSLGPTFSIVLVGKLQDKETILMLRSLRKKYLPNSTIVLMDQNKTLTETSYTMIDGKTTVYICRDKACMPPTNSVEKMLELVS